MTIEGCFVFKIWLNILSAKIELFFILKLYSLDFFDTKMLIP